MPYDEKGDKVERDAQQTLTSDIRTSLISGRITVTASWYQDIRGITIMYPRLSSKSMGYNHYSKAGDMRRECGVL